MNKIKSYFTKSKQKPGKDTPSKTSSDETASELLVVAFDFGTTYSGYAFSFRYDPLKVQANKGWSFGSNHLLTTKTPTCILLNKNREFDSFGFEAENKFASLAESNKHHGWLFFRRFKMILHNNKDLSRSTTVEDINGNSMPALTIFTMSIKYLKEHFWTAINKQKVGIKDEDIKYVITVPAIWNDNAKQFMREAAEKAGMAKSRLKLCFEPEAASVWCQTIDAYVKESLNRSGKQYMVIDLGGGTADISVHEKQIDGSLKELHKASGGPWGGTVVDDNFLKWLTEIFGESTMKRFKETQMEDYFILLRDFETKKREIKADSDGVVTIRLPVSLKEIYDERNKLPLQDRVIEMGLTDMVKLTGDKLRVEALLIKQLFDSPINSVAKHVQQILLKPFMQNVETILLVGGFGHFPDIIRSRIMTQTYGFSVVNEYDKQEHKNADEVFFWEDRKCVNNIFDTIIRVGEETCIGKMITKGPYVPIELDESCFEIYTTRNSDPKFVTDPDCTQIGKLTVSHANGRHGDDNSLMASFIFGDTELFVKAVNIRTKEEFSTYIDCL